MKTRLLALALLTLLTLPAVAAPAAGYHLELEASPSAAFPYFSRFGTVDLHVYRGGVRAEVLWLKAFSRTATDTITVMNPLARMYVEVPVREISSVITSLAGGEERVEHTLVPESMAVSDGKVKGIAAKRHRLTYGPAAYIDFWTTTTLPENPQLRRIVNELVRGISPPTAAATAKIAGVPLYVELNFRRFKKVVLIRTRELTMSADDEKDALERGSLYMRAGVLEKLWTK